jgi:putative ABC transport system ATP-binding protein
MSHLLRVNNLYRYHQSGASTIKAVDGVSLQIEKGDFVAITGASGSGKSTLLSLIAGLDNADKGEIWIEEVPLHTLNEAQRAKLRREKLGFIFQSFQLFENYTALENVQFPLELQSQLSPSEIKQAASKLLQQVGLQNRAAHYPKQLSGGEQQRVAIARAFATKPTLLLADEPTGNLDNETGEMVISALLELQIRTKCTVIMVTHDIDLSKRANRIFTMQQGKLEENKELPI